MILIQIHRYNTPNKHKLLFLQQIYVVLCVIMQPAGLTIDNKTYFKSVEKLIDNYKRQSLPNRRTTLMRGFSITEEQ